MKHLAFSIDGVPKPQKRPIVLRKGWTIDPPESAKEKKRIANIAQFAIANQMFRLIKGKVSIETYFYGADKRSDIDNLYKLVSDAMKGIAWEDDRQVCKVIATKEDCDKGSEYTWVVIREMEGE